MAPLEVLNIIVELLIEPLTHMHTYFLSSEVAFLIAITSAII